LDKILCGNKPMNQAFPQNVWGEMEGLCGLKIIGKYAENVCCVKKKK